MWPVSVEVLLDLEELGREDDRGRVLLAVDDAGLERGVELVEVDRRGRAAHGLDGLEVDRRRAGRRILSAAMSSGRADRLAARRQLPVAETASPCRGCACRAAAAASASAPGRSRRAPPSACGRCRARRRGGRRPRAGAGSGRPRRCCPRTCAPCRASRPPGSPARSRAGRPGRSGPRPRHPCAPCTRSAKRWRPCCTTMPAGWTLPSFRTVVAASAAGARKPRQAAAAATIVARLVDIVSSPSLGACSCLKS